MELKISLDDVFINQLYDLFPFKIKKIKDGYRIYEIKKGHWYKYNDEIYNTMAECIKKIDSIKYKDDVVRCKSRPYKYLSNLIPKTKWNSQS